MAAMTRKTKVQEHYCFGCECLLLTPDEKLGPICYGCFKKLKRNDALMRAALQKSVVAVTPIVCPHGDERGHHCRSRFHVIVLDKNLDPVEVTGPYSLREAERKAKRIRLKIERREK